jgi:hypothetical protein
MVQIKETITTLSYYWHSFTFIHCQAHNLKAINTTFSRKSNLVSMTSSDGGTRALQGQRLRHSEEHRVVGKQWVTHVER